MMSDEELGRIVTIIDSIFGPGTALVMPINPGDTVEAEFGAWLDTADGRFATWCAKNGERYGL